MADGHPSLPLSAAVTASVGGVLTIAVICAVTAVFVLRQTTVGALELENRERVRESARQALAIALLDEETGRSGMLATGNRVFLEAYERGVREETEAWTALYTAFGDSAESKPSLVRLRTAVDSWHEQIGAPQVFPARGVPAERLSRTLQDGQTRFDAIRAALGALAEEQAAAGQRRRAELARHGRRAIWAGAGLCAALIAAGALLLVWGRRRVAVPLQHLAWQVESGGRIEPSTRGGIREISTLHAALVRLDRRVAEREAVLRAEREDAEMLGRFADIVQQTTSDTELYRLLVRFLEVAVAPAGAAVFSLNPSENHLAMVHPSRSPDEQYKLPMVSDPMRCRAIRSARDVLFVETQDPGMCDCPLASSCSSYLCMPLMATGQVIGLVSLQGAAADHWTPRRRHLAASLATTASTTLNSIRLVARSRDNALRDPLTRAYNRRFLVEVLPKLVHQTTRTRAPLSALMVDVDRFKDFNDRHGHDAGDRVLAAVARCLGEQVRMSDTLVRYGGEEFAILLPNTSLQGAMAIAERAREAVENTRTTIPQAERPLAVTISIGVATLPEHGATGDDLLLAADKALFRAKDAGRNRTVAAAPTAGSSVTTLALAAAE